MRKMMKQFGGLMNDKSKRKGLGRMFGGKLPFQLIMNNIVLFQPEIPANTGNIARTCVGTNTRLHLIRPLGFSIDDKHVKRAGLDYWEHLDLVVWDSFDEFLEATMINIII